MKNIIFLKYLLFSFVILKICCGSKETDEIDDKNLPQVLIDLGKKLLEELLYPKYINGTYLLEDLFDYYNNLDDIQELIDSDDFDRAITGKELYKILFEKGGPPILKIEFDYEKLAKKYSWIKNGKDIIYVQQIIADIKDLWKTIGIKTLKIMSESTITTYITKSTYRY
uniref:Uncharacterized protein n=1 Tax=Clastoptera arizonana TaxID=38151 RepID=A0A1B6DK08_9HEMI